MPTLAAIFTLTTHLDGWQNCQPIQAALQFLNGQALHWIDKLPNDIPVAAELIIPKLLHDANEMQVPVPANIYDGLNELAKRRRKLISSMQPRAGTTAAFSWEAWGVDPDIAFLDSLGSVGHSPAATAAWLQKASCVPGLDSECSAAEEYLRKASSATQSDIPGLFPTAWPLDRFEQAFGLYALLSGGILTHPDIQTVVAPHIDQLTACMQNGGVGFTDHFEPDGDNTAAVVAVLGAVGVSDAIQMLDSFRSGVHCSSYPFELQPSLSVTARALHGYNLCEPSANSEHNMCRFLLTEIETDDGLATNGTFLGSIQPLICF